MFRLHCSPDLPEPPGAACLQRLEAVARRTLSCHSAGGSVEAILTDDDEVRRLNRTFRGRDRATDVLSFSYVDNQQALDLIRSGRVQVEDMITHRLPLDDIGEGFRLTCDGTESLKVIIEPNR